MRLKELRKAKKLKQIDIAEMLSCSQGVYSRYESGEREPPFDIMKKLAEIYGVTVDYLMGGALSEPTPAPAPVPAQEKAPGERRAEGIFLLEKMTDKQYARALAVLKALDEGQ